MALDDKLHWVCRRSEAGACHSHTIAWKPGGTMEKRIRVSDDLQVFEKRFTFVESVSLANDGLIFRPHARHDLRPVAVRVEARDASGHLCVRMKNDSLPANASAWQVRVPLRPGNAQRGYRTGRPSSL